MSRSATAAPRTATRPVYLAPPRLFFFLEGRALGEWATSMAAMPWLLEGPQGDGHPVLVLPGFIASGTSTAPLRRFLERKGYRAYCWEQGRNLGPSHELQRRLHRRLDQLSADHGRPVSLIGWSLGGIFARWLANESPDKVRQVITLGSPFAGDPRANHSWRLFERLSPRSIDDLSTAERESVRRDPPVPTTAIYSRTDGITSWRCCVTEPGPLAENIEVHGSHCGLGVNPMVLHAIGDRLAQPEGAWHPFRRTGSRRFLYPRPKGMRHEPLDFEQEDDTAQSSTVQSSASTPAPDAATTADSPQVA